MSVPVMRVLGLALIFVSTVSAKDCKSKGKKVCNGTVGSEMGSFVKICFDGILKFKKKDKVSPLPSCQVGEEIYCEGEVIEEKICNEESLESYTKKCQNGTPLWFKSSPESSLPSPSQHCSEAENPCTVCQINGDLFCEGEIIQEKNCNALEGQKESGGGYVRTCQNGKPRWQPPLCEWYGQAFCDGELVEDLYRWWYLLKCSQGKMRVLSRAWGQVVADPRYQALSQDDVENIVITE